MGHNPNIDNSVASVKLETINSSAVNLALTNTSAVSLSKDQRAL